MDPADHLAFDAAGEKQSDTAFKVQYTDCTAEVLDLVHLCKVGCPCTSLCEQQLDCSRAKPAMYHRKRWVLAEHDTERNKELLLSLGGTPQQRKQVADTSSSDDDEPLLNDASSTDDDLPLCKVHQNCRPRESSSDDDAALATASPKQGTKRPRPKRHKR